MVSTLIKIIIFTDTILISLLPKFLLNYLIDVDIEVTEHHNEESFFQSLNPDDSTSYFIIIKSERHAKRLLDRTHPYSSVQSIYLQCDPTELKCQRRLARNYSKLDAVFDDNLPLWIALIMDIALFCEETADRQKHDTSLMKAAHKNYQRSMDLYALAKGLI